MWGIVHTVDYFLWKYVRTLYYAYAFQNQFTQELILYLDSLWNT